MRCPSPANRTERALRKGRLGAALSLALAAIAAATPVRAEVIFDCVIEPSRVVLVGSPVTGVLAEVAVERGSRVRQGQLLARLETGVETATVALQEMRASDTSSLSAQRARLALAERRMARVDRLVKRGVATRDSFDEATAELEVSRAEITRLEMQQKLALMELERAEAALALRTIESPLDGIVIARTLSPGEFVNQDAHIVQVADLDPLHVEVYLSVGYFDQLAIGQTGVVEPVGANTGRHEAEISVIDHVFDASSNTFGVRLALANPQARLPAGQRCRVTLAVDPVETAGTDYRPPAPD